jgi:membrane-bound ClpP family serine protease
VGLIFFFIVGKAVATLKMTPASGAEGLIGETAIVKTPLSPAGTVFADGTRWNATLAENETAVVGEAVEIVEVEGLKLIVRRKA